MLPIINNCTKDELMKLAYQGRLHGLYQIPSEIYHSIPALNSSSLKDFAVSPLNYKNRVSQPMKETPAMQFGTAAHCKVLEPEKFDDEYIVSPQFMGSKTKKKENGGCKEDWDEWKKADHGDKIPLDYWAGRRLDTMQFIFHGFDKAHKILQLSYKELSAFWRCSATGILCKARFDMLSRDYGVIDYKTTSIDFNEPQFEMNREIVNRKYWLQISFYLKAVIEMAELSDVQPIGSWIFQKTTGGHEIGHPYMKDITDSMMKCNDLVRRFAECQASGHWPTIMIDSYEFELPGWI